MQALICALSQLLRQTQLTTHPQQRQAALLRIGAEFFQRTRANLAARGVDHAQKRRVIVRVGQKTQIGGQVADFRTLKERLAAGNVVGNRVLTQRAFEHTRLVIAAIEHSVVGELGALFELVLQNFDGHAQRLIVAVGAEQGAQRLAFA